MKDEPPHVPNVITTAINAEESEDPLPGKAKPSVSNRLGGSFNFQPGQQKEQAPSPLIKVPLSRLLHHNSSKDEILYNLEIKGQLWLPIKRKTTLFFVKQLLSREKLYLQRYQVTQPKIPRLKALSVARVWSMVKGNEAVCKYLPDLEEDDKPEDVLDRPHFFAIVHTMDSTFFVRAMDELARIRSHRRVEDEGIQVDQAMLSLIQTCRASASAKRGCKQALAVLKVKSKKRKRPTKTETPQLEVRFKGGTHVDNSHGSFTQHLGMFGKRVKLN